MSESKRTQPKPLHTFFAIIIGFLLIAIIQGLYHLLAVPILVKMSESLGSDFLSVILKIFLNGIAGYAGMTISMNWFKLASAKTVGYVLIGAFVIIYVVGNLNLVNDIGFYWLTILISFLHFFSTIAGIKFAQLQIKNPF